MGHRDVLSAHSRAQVSEQGDAVAAQRRSPLKPPTRHGLRFVGGEGGFRLVVRGCPAR